MQLHSLRKQVRIGLDARFFRNSTGGIGRYTRELIYQLAKLDQNNEYLVFLTEEDLAEWDITQANFTPVVVKAKHYTLKEQTQFLQLLYRLKLDLVHFLNFNHPILYRRPFVATLHDITMLRYPNPGRKGLVGLARRKVMEAVMRNLKHAKRVIAVSEFTALDAERVLRLPHAMMEVILEGAPEPQVLGAGSKKQLLDYIGFKEPYFLFVSQWRAHKGIGTLIEAFNQFKSETGLPHKLLILGRQDKAPQSIKDKIIQSPYGSDIVCPGLAPDELLPIIYGYAEALLFTSEYEGFGLPLLEAMAQGTPVISAKNTSLVEVGGDAVLFFETGNGVDLCQKMIQLLQNPQLGEELQKLGYKQLKHFRWDNTAKRTLELYRNILEKQG